MGSERTWNAWKVVFQRHEVGALHNIDTYGLFNEMTDSCRERRKYKFVPMNSNQMKNLMGMDDNVVNELAEKIKST